MGCSASVGQSVASPAGSKMSRRASSIRSRGSALHDAIAAANSLEAKRQLIENTAFFQGITQSDLDHLARIVKPVDHARKSSLKVPFPRTENQILLGGIRISWDYVANQSGLTTRRSDVVGEECLLRLGDPITATQGRDQSGQSTSLSEMIATVAGGGSAKKMAREQEPQSSVFDIPDDSSSRDDFEYLICDRINENKKWFRIESRDIIQLAKHSSTFNELISKKLQPRAQLRGTRQGLLHCLTESEFHYLSQAFDFFTLSDVAKAFNTKCNNSGEELVFGVICDGKVRMTLEQETSTENGMSPVTKRRLSPSLSSSNGHLAEPSNPTTKMITASFELGAGHLIGESEVFLEMATCSTKVEVLEEGVMLGLRASAWSMFIESVASEQTKKLLLEKTEWRSSVGKLRSLFPCLRRCKDAPLRLLLDAAQTEFCSFASKMPAEEGMVYFLRHGTVMLRKRGSEVEDESETVELRLDERCESVGSNPATPQRAATSATAVVPIITHCKYIKHGQPFGYEPMLRAQRTRATKAALSLSSSIEEGEAAMRRVADEDVVLYTATGSWSELPSNLGSSSSMSSQPTAASTRSAGSGSSGQPYAGSMVWKIPAKVLLQLFAIDPIFGADFEFIVCDYIEPQLSFSTILNHPIALSYFRRYLVSIHAQENLDFYWTTRYFPRTVSQVIDELRAQWDSPLNSLAHLQNENGETYQPNRDRVVEILKEFVVNGAPNQININSETNNRLLAAVNDSEQSDRHIFDAAMEEVFGILASDSFPRFMANRDNLGEMLRAVQAGDVENMFRSPLQSLTKHSSQSQLNLSPIRKYRSLPTLGAGVNGTPNQSGAAPPRFSARKGLFSSGGAGNQSGVGVLDFGAL